MTTKAMASGRTLVFVPMYNCAAQIARVVDQIAEGHHPDIGLYLFVDNRSSDDTLAVATRRAREKLADRRFLVVRNVENYGLGGSHKVAFEYALSEGFERVVVFHGDDQARLGDAREELDRDPTLGDECRLGARFMPGSRLDGYSTVRTLGNLVFNVAFGLAGRQPVFDLGSGLNLYSRRFLERGLFRACNDDLTFNYHLLLHSMTFGVAMGFFPISWRESDQRSNVKMVRQAAKMLSMLAAYVVDRRGFYDRLLAQKRGRAYRFETMAEGRP